jgi:hypothetical protein
MDANAIGSLIGRLVVYLTFILPALLFLFSQQRTLSAIRPEYRELKAGMVWLQLIPVFNLYWMFVVVTRIADSISKELVALQNDSILGLPDFDAVKAVSHRPTYKIGMAYCSLFLFFPGSIILGNIVGHKAPEMVERVWHVAWRVAAVATVTCWIIYWVKLAQNKRKLERLL